jgi:hypothetical protein
MKVFFANKEKAVKGSMQSVAKGGGKRPMCPSSSKSLRDGPGVSKEEKVLGF